MMSTKCPYSQHLFTTHDFHGNYLDQQDAVDFQIVMTACRSPSLNLVSPAQFPTVVAHSQDPVVAGDGFTYERSCIEDWLKERTSKTARFVALVVEVFLEEILEMGSFFCSLQGITQKKHKTSSTA